MIKKFITISIVIFSLSCSAVTPLSKYHIKEIASIASKRIFSESFDKVQYKDMRIYKKGYGTWYISAYGDYGIYLLEIDEDGNVMKFLKNEYSE
ncbi:hypothetical protein STFE110948_00325 [Streptobacillus felis]|uniref:PepSY domain-containing protein n=1 Tax=Streptobacillus felis TaxID=1384509 RepID=A0A7Z0PE15_9FUSO|nr:hypothetical protein [Streptobacillus felis]NYV27299.1 hypothetical protein [Streptobacillus felis]